MTADKGRIRLQVQVLSWEDPNSSTSDTRQEELLPWTEPCAADLTINDLAEKIENRFERIYRGKG